MEVMPFLPIINGKIAKNNNACNECNDYASGRGNIDLCYDFFPCIIDSVTIFLAFDFSKSHLQLILH